MGGRGVSHAGICGQCSRQRERNHVQGKSGHKGLCGPHRVRQEPWEDHEQRRVESGLNLARPLWQPHGKWARVAPGIRVGVIALVQGQLRGPCRGQVELWASS